MAAIPSYTASVGLRSPGIPDTRLISPDGAALERVGASIEDAAALFQRKDEQREEFKADNDWRKLQLDLGQGLIDSEQNAPVDGAGFHDGFVENVFRPRRDEFLSKIPARLREKYGTLLGDDGADAAGWSMKAAAKERDIASTWVKNEIGITQNDLANAISQDPKAYDAFYQSGADLIRNAPMMTAIEKRVALQSWDSMAQTAYLNRLMEDDPQLVLRELGANPNLLAPATQLDVLSSAVQSVESGGKPNAISPVGAVGTHQVMPGTARDIAKAMGDTNFPTGGDPEQVTQYLLRPGMSKRYGDFYLRQLQKQFPNDTEAVLIAYNGGPGRAKAWLKAGRDDSVLPTETAAYYKKVLGTLGTKAPGANAGTVPPAGVNFVFSREGKAPIANQTVDKLHPDLVGRVQTSFAALGIRDVKINSGFRDEGDNARVGGAKQSQHLHGNAMDIDVTGYTHAQRVELIKSLSANGITGLGIGANIIHADIGPRRAWGYPNIPPWAQPAIAEHEAGKSLPPRGGTSRFSTLPYDKRQQFINAADQKLSSQLVKEAQATAVEKVQVRQSMTNELALLTNTGQGSGRFDETQIATILGEDDYITYADKKAEATKLYTAKQDVPTMSPTEMEERLTMYEPDPSSGTFASDQKVHAALVKEIDRVTRLRAKEPDKAAMEFPDVRTAVTKATEGVNEGKPVPADIQMMTTLLLDRQKQFGIPEKAMAPMPKEWAFELGSVLSQKVPTRSKDVSAEEVRAAIAAQYAAVQQLFGDYADEAIIYALSEYKGIPKSTAEQITALMGAVAAGKSDPFRLKTTDAGDVERLADPSFFSYEYWFGSEGGDKPDDGAVEEQLSTDNAPPSPELILRTVGALNGVETPEDEAAIVQRYGQAAVDAAKRKIEGGATE